MQACRCFTLIGRVLRRKAVELRHTKPLELAEMIAKRTGLRCAASRARDLVPSGGWINARNACPWINVDNSPAPEPRQVDRCSIRRRKRQIGQLCTREMPRCTVILRDWDLPVAEIADYACPPLRSFLCSIAHKFHERTVRIAEIDRRTRPFCAEPLHRPALDGNAVRLQMCYRVLNRSLPFKTKVAVARLHRQTCNFGRLYTRPVHIELLVTEAGTPSQCGRCTSSAPITCRRICWTGPNRTRGLRSDQVLLAPY